MVVCEGVACRFFLCVWSCSADSSNPEAGRCYSEFKIKFVIRTNNVLNKVLKLKFVAIKNRDKVVTKEFLLRLS